MYENYGLYIVFFLISSFIFIVIGLNLRYYKYTGKDWYQIIIRMGVIIIMIVLMIWAFTVKTDVVEQLNNNVTFLVNVCLFVFIPLLLGESLSSVIYNVLYAQ